ncbi:osmosensitive K+ channel response regulator [Liquorilactobacillus ghanensis DSM 18630]|uniref:Osmosensitive K+ channel response regulator n=1 Tax=Liquorilactobacillus ghanensis DSM 18630 TaxID=1423750 RepID=A0A0R1VXI4_9LACO|nr:osmosensitive K+ channel response regulator [Liquorilactobacillus ghanensis DSM 18630]
MLVEDDQEVGRLIAMTLKANQYQFEWAKTGQEALDNQQLFQPAVILLDLGLPDFDGVEVIEKIRQEQLTPIIVISARSDETDKITALDKGADDYLIKPFSINEMLARVRVALRRKAYLENTHDEQRVYRNGSLKIDFFSRTAYLAKRQLNLTETTYNLLCLFADNTAKVLTHGFLMRTLWPDKPLNDTTSLRVAIAALRKELEPEQQSPKFIKTHIGVGYSFIQN